MKKTIFFLMSAVAFVSCSKNESNQDVPLLRKSIPGSATEVHSTVVNFVGDYNEYLNTNNASTTQDIDFEYAVWLLEAATNYHNRGDGVTPMYVERGSKMEAAIDVEYLMVENDPTVSLFISEEELFDTYNQLILNLEGKAPFTDLELVGDVNNLTVAVTSYTSLVNQPYVGCNASLDPAAWGYPILQPTTGSCSQSTTPSATSFIDDALHWENTRHNNQCYLAYSTYGYSLEGVFAGITPDNNSSLNGKLFAYRLQPSGNRVSVGVGTGTDHSQRLYGVANYNQGSASTPSTDCWTFNNVKHWKDMAQEIIDIEDPNVNPHQAFIDANIAPKWYNNGAYGYHNLYLRRASVMPTSAL